MKLKKLFFATMALFALAACTETPDSPYEFPNGGGGNNGGTTEEGVYINEKFASDFGVFSTAETVGDTPWIIDYSTAKATSYIDGTNKAATSWLISSPVDFTNETEAYVAFEYIIRYSESGKVAANHQLLVSADFAGDAAKATWKDVPYGAVEGSDWATFYKANVDVPAEFMGKSGIVFALRYTATTTKASTWEVKNFKVAHGTAAEPEEPEEAEEYTVAEALAAFTGVAKPAVVKGYIVGTVDGQVYTDGCRFSGSAESKTNLLLADKADETDPANCMPIQLPSGAVRNALNLVDNPGNYLKEVKLTGSLEKYFGVPGLKTVTKYEIEGETPEEPGDEPVSGENILSNSDFEVWEGGKPAYWGLTVTNGTYSQSADAHSGASAVLIEGNAQSNKRLASKSYTLKAGTYHMSAYFKQSGEAAGQFRLGYAKLTDGVVADTQNDYIYITDATPVSQEWQEVKCEFTLNAETEVGIIIMNSKYGGGASILVDDVTIITADGGIVEGTEGEEPEQPETPETGGSLFAESFATSLGSFTTQETIGNFPWTFDERYGAKASGYDQTSQDAESWLISPAINFTGINTAYISFDYVINKGDASLAAADHKVMVTESYTGDVATTNWIEVPYGAYNDGSWNFHNTGNIALPEAIMNNSAVVIAFKYTSTTANSSTWELKNVVVAAGEGETPEEPETPDTPDTPDTPEEPEEPDTPATEGGVFDFTNPEGLTPSVKRATVEAGSTQGAGVEASEYTFTNGNVTVKVSQGSATTPVRFWTRTGGDVELRTYKSSTITVSATEGTLSSIVFEGGKVSTMTASTGSFSAGTWSGNAQSVTFSVTGTLNIQKLTAK